MSKTLILALGLAAVLLLAFGCLGAGNGAPPNAGANASVQPPPASPNAGAPASICGNGKVEAGETSATCCLDTSCPQGQTCAIFNVSERGPQSGCVKAAKNETAQVQQIRTEYAQMKADLQAWMDANQTSPLTAQTVFAHLRDMNASISGLEQAGYDTADELYLYEAADMSSYDAIDLAGRLHAAQKRVDQSRGLARERYLNALNLSMQDTQDAIIDAKLYGTRLTALWNADPVARMQAVRLYGLEENFYQIPIGLQAELEDYQKALKLEFAREAPHNQNEWVQSGDMRIRLSSLRWASCARSGNGATITYLVIPAEVENQGDSEVSFGPSAFRVRDWQKNQYSPAAPPVNSTSADCVEYEEQHAGLNAQALLPGSRAGGEVWVDVGSGRGARPWEIYADMPGGGQVLFRITPS